MPDPIGTIYRVTLNCAHVTGAIINNIFTFQANDATHDRDLLYNDIAAKFWSSAGGTKWQFANVAGTTLQNVTIDTWTIETATVPAPKVYTGTLPVNGAFGDWPGAGFHTPAVLAQHAILRTAISGRSFRGRLYFGPGCVAGTASFDAPSDGWRWAANITASFQAFLDMVTVNYTNSIGPPIWSWGVWSRRLGGNLRSGRYVNTPPYHAAGFTPIVSATAMRGIRTQRRREAPRGV